MRIHTHNFQRLGALTALAALAACSGGSGGGNNADAAATTLVGPTHSTTIALTRDDKRAIVVNRDADTISVINVRNATGQDVGDKIAEIPVGREPRAIAIAPNDRRCFVANTVSGTVSVVDLSGSAAFTVVAEIRVGTEPRALALTPNGKKLYVANHTQGTVSIVDTATLAVVATVDLGGNPAAIAISNDGDKDDLDETVYVSEFYAEVIPGGPGEGFDNGKRGVVWAFDSNTAAAPRKITIAPIANSGFGANRAPFCAAFNATVHSQIFCPDTNALDPNAAVIAADPQGAYPNQLQALVLRDDFLYVPNIGASPEPPVKFNVNVQALVNVVDTVSEEELPDFHVNLNEQIKAEVQPANPTASLDRLFGNDIVAIDATQDGQKFLIVSRGGNYVIQAGLDANGKLTIGAPTVKRYQTGNLPNGIVVSRDGKRAYANNEAGFSVTAIDLVAQTVITRDIASATPPVPGTFAHGVLVGKIAFETALGMPDFGVFGTPVREIVPLSFRGKASDNAWSSCASCHPDGLADGVTWIFGTGPRQTLPLDAFFDKQSPLDQRISNWSGVMGSVTDFNNNSIGVQGGTGFAGTPPPVAIFQHGITEGGSDSLDAMTLWVQTVRSPILPAATNVIAATTGESLFQQNCASCHGGAKWSKSQVVYDNDPTFNKDPNNGGVPLDAGVTNAGPQIVSFTEGTHVLKFLEQVGTFDIANPLELRGQGAAAGKDALGALGFNVPSLLGARYHAPYLHDGSAPTLAAVFAKHKIGAQTIAQHFTVAELEALQAFVDTIDGSSFATPSETDQFLQGLGN